ncbi:MAG: endopeptidase La [Clostridia bacterium]|nr:endopeptidase La [Clostridia bacterium]
MSDTILQKRALPVLALRNLVVFPDQTVCFEVGRFKSIRAIRSAVDTTDRQLFLVTQKDATVEDPKVSELYDIGVVAEIKQISGDGNRFEIVVEGLYRARMVEVLREKASLRGVIEQVEEIQPDDKDLNTVATLRLLKERVDAYVNVSPRIAPEIFLSVLEESDIAAATDDVAGHFHLQVEDKQKLLSELNVLTRAEKLCSILSRETEILEIETQINEKVQERMDKHQREYYLREQIKVASNELGEDDSPIAEADKYKEKIKALPIDDRSRKRLLDECDRFIKTTPGSPEANVARTYLERVVSLPWGVLTEDNLDVQGARKILEKDHYGLEEVKERILELIAVKKLAPDAKAQILCLVGPPGVGKTSIARSLAEAMGRKYVRISLGGVHDEAEIRGHRRTYIGSMPGRIITAIEQAGTSNPLVLLDEIDKLGSDYKGDPSSALLEVLDGEQNSTFTDHYIDVPFDLSKVLFITTANDPSQIPGPLYDRMEIIELYSYTAEDKFSIAKKYLIPKQIKNFGMNSKMLRFTDAAIRALIADYTKEAGVRTLDRTITKIIRKVAVKFADGFEGKFTVSPSNLEELLGAPKYKTTKLDFEEMIGAANGLAWTSVGGEMMQIEVAVLEGSGKLELTGSLGDVMKESAKAAISFIRSRCEKLGIDSDFYKNKDIHIHVPEGAVPKDGPSAGVTITTALVSALTETPVNKSVAMTGEITLRGKVLPIGGLREKSTAAFKNGMKAVLIPEGNKADLDKVNDTVKNAIEFIPVSNLDEVLSISLVNKGKKRVDKINNISKKNINENITDTKTNGVYCKEI